MAPGQTPEEVLRLLRAAVGHKRPIAAVYNDCRRLLCPHRLGWNREGQRRVLCYQYGGASLSGLEPRGARSNWRCLAVDKLLRVELFQGQLAYGAQPLSAANLHRASRDGCRGSARGRPAKRAMREVPQQVACNRDADRGDGVRIMPLGTDATPAGGSPGAAAGRIVQDFRCVQRGKNGSAQRSGTHKPRCREWLLRHSTETGSNKLGQTLGTPRQSSTRPASIRRIGRRARPTDRRNVARVPRLIVVCFGGF
jgi:hypothetical protein